MPVVGVDWRAHSRSWQQCVFRYVERFIGMRRSMSSSSEEPLQNPSQSLLNRQAHPKRHLVYALISSLFFCVTGKSITLRSKAWIFFRSGMVAVFYAIKSLQCERHGHYEQAVIHARRSFSWSMASFVIGLFVYLTLGLLVFIRSINQH